LLAHGADINSRFRLRDGSPGTELLELTSLGEACRLGRFEDALKLIDLGADVNMGLQELETGRLPAPSDDPNPPQYTHIPLLHVCCMNFSRRDQELFPSKHNIWRPAQLQKAFRSKVIARLLAAGSSLDARWDPGDSRMETPLSVAVRHNNVPAVKTLLAASADSRARDPKGRNALMIAVEEPRDHRSPHGGLVDHQHWGFLPRSPLPPPKDRSDKWTIVKLLLDAGIPVNEADAQGDTVLHILFVGCRDRPDAQFLYPRPPAESWMTPPVEGHILRLLLARDADPCLRNSSGASALRVAVKQGHTSAVEAIACQRRIDLVRDFPMDEILAIFDAVPHSRELPDPRVPNDYGASESKVDVQEFLEIDTAGLHLLNTLVDMDGMGRLSSNVPFICSRLLQGTRLGSSSELAEILCFRGLEMGSFDGDAKLELLRTAIKAGSQDVARSLLRDTPQAEINSLDGNGQSLLSLSITTKPHLNRTSADDAIFVMDLIEGGADIHRCVSPTLPHGGDTTPLKRALLYGKRYPIEQMLRKQPLLGNPEVIGQRYLHWAVALPWRADLASVSGGEPAGTEDTIRILLRAGADPAQLDDDGNTPMSLVLRELVLKMDLLRKTYHWLKPLSRGVDINHKNKEGRSAFDYLQTILDSDVDFLDKVLHYDRVPDGKGEKMVLLWLK
jgi:ankyrin repeat protein